MEIASTPIRFMCGRASFNDLDFFGDDAWSKSIVTPVMLPLGRARLATWPRPTGSACVANTMGIVFGRLSSGIRLSRRNYENNIDIQYGPARPPGQTAVRSFPPIEIQ